MTHVLRRVWGETMAVLHRGRSIGWPDLLVVVIVAGLLRGALSFEREWTQGFRPGIEIDLSLKALPTYAFFSLSRGAVAYVLSLLFSLGYGYWAAKDRVAERLLVPLLDVLQSIPVLGFMPGLVIALVAQFPGSNAGLESAAILMIFTSQAWNMTFSFYHAVRSVPVDQREVAAAYRFGWWQRLRQVELPFAATGLVWNSMMSVAGGWFFLMVSEAFVLGDQDYRLPGLGSYMSVATARGDTRAMVAGVVTMVALIVLLDQLVWRPVTVWAQKFRGEESAIERLGTSWVIDWLKRSQIVAGLGRLARKVPHLAHSRRASLVRQVRVAGQERRAPKAVSWTVFAGLVGLLAVSAARLVGTLGTVSAGEWMASSFAALTTLGRVLVATVLGTVWALPAGLAIGLSPRWSRLLQPIVQIAASFPAPMLYPAVVVIFSRAHVSLGWGSIFLMFLGTQWYILFNVVAGASAIPCDLREAATSYRLRGWQRFWRLHLPAVFPYLVTGWVTAAGGAWNASIVAEYISFHGEVFSTSGIGARISLAAEHADFARLASSVVVMAVLVVAFNRLVWRPLYRTAAERFSLAK